MAVVPGWMGQWLRAIAVPAEDPSSVLSTHSRELTAPGDLIARLASADTCTQVAHTHTDTYMSIKGELATK